MSCVCVCVSFSTPGRIILFFLYFFQVYVRHCQKKEEEVRRHGIDALGDTSVYEYVW